MQEFQLPSDTILVIRCPHCMAGIDFRPMIAHKDGRFVCRDCAHTVCPGVPRVQVRLPQMLADNSSGVAGCAA